MNNLEKIQQLIYSGDITNINLAQELIKGLNEDAINVWWEQFNEAIELAAASYKLKMDFIKLITLFRDKGLVLRWENQDNPILELLAPIVFYLEIRDSNFDKIPNIVNKFIKVETLIIRDNSSIPILNNIEKLTTLKKIHCYNTEFIEINSSIKNCTNLEFIELQAVHYVILPDELATLPKLERVHYLIGSGSDLTEGAFTYLPDVLFQLPHVKGLRIEGYIFEHLPKDISMLKKLEILYINNMSLEHLALNLDGLEYLKNLVLTNLPNITILPEFIYKCQSLENLYIEKLAITDLDIEALSLSSLKYLHISNCPYTYNKVKELKEELTIALPNIKISVA